jgi:hypothetical protein
MQCYLEDTRVRRRKVSSTLSTRLTTEEKFVRCENHDLVTSYNVRS